MEVPASALDVCFEVPAVAVAGKGAVCDGYSFETGD